MIASLMPRLRIPLWAAVAVPAAAYAIRSIIRGYWMPDLPGDAVVLGILAAVLLLGRSYRRSAHDDNENLEAEVHEKNSPEGDGGQ